LVYLSVSIITIISLHYVLAHHSNLSFYLHHDEYTFHCYDHCPFGNRLNFWMDHYFGIPYQKVVYGYGSGALPTECEGEGYDGELNPRQLTGKKQLPVLEGPGVPCEPDAVGMPESLEICSFLIARHGLDWWCLVRRALPMFRG
jgi:hypothetical protein